MDSTSSKGHLKRSPYYSKDVRAWDRFPLNLKNPHPRPGVGIPTTVMAVSACLSLHLQDPLTVDSWSEVDFDIFAHWNFAVISQFRITLVNSFLLSFHQFRPVHGYDDVTPLDFVTTVSPGLTRLVVILCACACSAQIPVALKCDMKPRSRLH